MKPVPNSYPLIREAKVTDTADPEKLGRIQLKVYPELAEIPDADCPWCFPFSGGVHGKSFGLPLKGRLVSCIVWSKYWNEITFLPFSITKPAEHLFSAWKDNQKSKITDMQDDPDEERFAAEEYEDGFTVFHDTKNSQHGFLHPKETFVTVNKDGDVFIQSVKKLTFHSKDSGLTLEADSESGDVAFKTKGGADFTVGKDAIQTIKGKQNSDITGDAAFAYKANWKVSVTGNTEIKTSGNTKIESSGTLNVKSSGPCTVESSAMTTVKGSSAVVADAPVLHFKGQKSNGQVIPSGSGVCCALPVCVASGVPHSG